MVRMRQETHTPMVAEYEPVKRRTRLCKSLEIANSVSFLTGKELTGNLGKRSVGEISRKSLEPVHTVDSAKWTSNDAGPISELKELNR